MDILHMLMFVMVVGYGACMNDASGTNEIVTMVMVNDATADTVAPDPKCKDNEVKIGSNCVQEMILLVFGASLGGYVVLLLTTGVVVYIVRSRRDDKKKDGLPFNPKYRANTEPAPPAPPAPPALWSTQDSNIYQDPSAPNGSVPRRGAQNKGYADETEMTNYEGLNENRRDVHYDIPGENNSSYSPRSNRSSPSRSPRPSSSRPEYRDSRYANLKYQGSPQDQRRQSRDDRNDPYMDNLEQTDVYRNFNANLNINSNYPSSYSIQRPKVNAGERNSNQGSNGRFSGEEIVM